VSVRKMQADEADLVGGIGAAVEVEVAFVGVSAAEAGALDPHAEFDCEQVAVSYAPSGLGMISGRHPMACAMGSTLSPLRGLFHLSALHPTACPAAFFRSFGAGNYFTTGCLRMHF
jgi:hypothetical protein